MMPVGRKYRELGTMVEGKIGMSPTIVLLRILPSRVLAFQQGSSLFGCLSWDFSTLRGVHVLFSKRFVTDLWRTEAGIVKKSTSAIMMPNKQQVEVTAVYTETEDEVGVAQAGDQVRLRLRDIDEDDILSGFVLCSPKRLVHNVSAFEAHIRILEARSIITNGFNCVLHIHAAIEEVTFAALLHTLQRGTNRRSKRAPTHAKKGDSIIARIEVIGGAGSVCVEKYDDYAQMGRFTLRGQLPLTFIS